MERLCLMMMVTSFTLVCFDLYNISGAFASVANILVFTIQQDFGFIFDIAPGGINFESSPFKLTAEMIQVMGGGADVQTFKWFSELVVKAYLASR